MIPGITWLYTVAVISAIIPGVSWLYTVAYFFTKSQVFPEIVAKKRSYCIKPCDTRNNTKDETSCIKQSDTRNHRKEESYCIKPGDTPGFIH
jgi:hypothetical protein